MINREFNSIIDLLQTFPDEQSCTNHLTELRWSDEVISPFISTSKIYVCKNNRYKCKETGKYFNVKTGTLFDNTKIKLQKWFVAIYLITSHKKGISSIQLSKDIGVTQKTAWFMLQRIRACFGISDEDKLSGKVEIDETYVGGKNKNRHLVKKVANSQGRSTKDKTAVVGMVQRGGRVIAKKVKDVQLNTIQKLIECHVTRHSILYTDEYQVYSALQLIHDHRKVNHSSDQYVIGGAHTNTIEGFWSLFKRGVIGIYHFVSRKHMQRYLDEFSFRYNTRGLEEGQRMNFLLSRNEVRTTYKSLIKK